VMVLMPLTHPACRLGVLLGIRPLRWIGVRSYGIYLWHAPIIILTNPGDHPAPDPVRSVLQVGATFLVAALSWKYLEEPIRRGAIGRFFARRRADGWGWQTFSPPARAVMIGSAVVLVVAVVGMAGVNSAPEGSPEYLPIPSQRIENRYAEVGAAEQHLEISGARSIEEQFEGEPNAQEVAEAWKAEGFNGCWVLALGTNEAANVAAGSTVDERERIEKMMAIIGDEPVLWVNVRSLEAAGRENPYYSKENMEAWDEELIAACAVYPNMRVYDWASDVKDAWFIDDGIHFTSPGYAARAQLIAQALAHAFPAKGETEGGFRHCVVS
jgi:hypothetical protein